LGDFNGDGTLDIAGIQKSAEVYHPAVYTKLGTGTGSFGIEESFTAGMYQQNISIGDVNNDGKLDLVAISGGGGQYAGAFVYLGTGTPISGSFDSVGTPPVGWGLGNLDGSMVFSTGNRPMFGALGDLNGDGNLDIATANWETNYISVLFGDGTGSFGTGAQFSVGFGLRANGHYGSTRGIAIEDLNADGKLDLVTANNEYNSISVLLGDGTGSFGTPTLLAAGSFTRVVAIADLNGDGKPDIAAANYAHSNISVFLGDGTGSFGSSTEYGTGNKTKSLAIGDLNGDGIPDLATAGYGNDTPVSVLLGNGDGSFGNNIGIDHGQYGGTWDMFSIAIGDLNNDGRPDLAVTNDGGAETGTFAILATSPTP